MCLNSSQVCWWHFRRDRTPPSRSSSNTMLFLSSDFGGLLSQWLNLIGWILGCSHLYCSNGPTIFWGPPFGQTTIYVSFFQDVTSVVYLQRCPGCSERIFDDRRSDWWILYETISWSSPESMQLQDEKAVKHHGEPLNKPWEPLNKPMNSRYFHRVAPRSTGLHRVPPWTQVASLPVLPTAAWKQGHSHAESSCHFFFVYNILNLKYLQNQNKLSTYIHI